MVPIIFNHIFAFVILKLNFDINVSLEIDLLTLQMTLNYHTNTRNRFPARIKLRICDKNNIQIDIILSEMDSTVKTDQQ